MGCEILFLNVALNDSYLRHSKKDWNGQPGPQGNAQITTEVHNAKQIASCLAMTNNRGSQEKTDCFRRVGQAVPRND